MLFKVLFQESNEEVPLRERTKSLYIKADSDREVRKKLADRSYNIEFIQPLNEAHLEYEQQSEHFEVETVS